MEQSLPLLVESIAFESVSQNRHALPYAVIFKMAHCSIELAAIMSQFFILQFSPQDVTHS